MSHGINPNQIDIVLGFTDQDLTKWRILQEHYSTSRFFFYKDTRPDLHQLSHFPFRVLHCIVRGQTASRFPANGQSFFA